MEYTAQHTTIETTSKFIGKVFLYMFLALILTALVSCGVAYLFKYLVPIYNTSNPLADNNAFIYLGVLVGSLILLVITGFWFNIRAARAKHSLVVPFVIYAILMGILGSSIALFYEPATISMAFGITAICFGSMALIGLISKRNLNFLVFIISGLSIGALSIYLFSFLWMFIFPEGAIMSYWIVSLVIFGVVMLITIVDVWRIKKIAQTGMANNNVALYCAFNIYIDFINIFVRVLYLLAISKRD